MSRSDPKLWMTGTAYDGLKAACRYIAQIEKRGQELATEAETARRRSQEWRKESERSDAEAAKAKAATIELAAILGAVTEDWTVEQWKLYTGRNVREIAEAQGWIALAKWEAGTETEDPS